MSLTGNGSFGNYDRTAKAAGSPLSRQATHEDAPGTAIAADDKPAIDSGLETSDAPGSALNLKEKDSGATSSDTATETGDVDAVEENRRHSMVQSLARRYTSQSHAAGAEANLSSLFQNSADPNSPLNPNGDKFNAQAWAKAVVDMVNEEGHEFRTTGVAFQNMNVHGFGAATDYQKDVANVWLDVVGLARHVVGGGKKRRIDILRNFDGLVRSGEMLVVLGPPGSGCSTFLKTIAGDMNGIFVDDSTYFNYQGE